MVGLTEMHARLTQMRQDILVPTREEDYLFNALPSLAEWQGATLARIKPRGRSNPELLHIDAELIRFNRIAAGERASAVRRIDALVSQWFLRKGPGAAMSRRFAPMDIMRQIVAALRQHVIYDRDAWLLRHRITPGPQDIIPGGFSDTGRTFEDLRQSLIGELSGISTTTQHNDSMNEADRRILGTFGLWPGAQFCGSAACFSAADWAKLYIRGTFPSFRDRTRQYHLAELNVQRNRADTHRYARDTNGVIVDPTWRQFFQGAHLAGTPAIFVGTIEDMFELVLSFGGDPSRLARIYD